MESLLVALLGAVVVVLLFLVWVANKLAALQQGQEQLDRSGREESSRNRQEQSNQSQALRSEVISALTGMGDSLSSKVEGLTRSNDQKLELLRDSMLAALTRISQLQQNELQELKITVDSRLAAIQAENEKKLEQMRQTVDEKLQGTLDARLGESFKQVSDRLEQVFKGLGEMQTLAAGVGDLKRVLTNVKTRGTWGEVQLGALLEQMLAPGQYGQNVATTGTAERVEYAVKLPGPDTNGAPIWLPIDAKFPVEDYQRLVDASERGEVESVERAVRQLETTLKLCAKNLSEKYIAPPATTDFGILFLSTEGLYAEAMRRPGLAEFIQREHRIVLAGPSTLAALLNSFQMGFRTLAIQQRSSEVWELLGTVKSEFGKYADVLTQIKRKLTEAHNTVERAETRTRAIHRKLRDVETTDGVDPIENDTVEDAEPELRILVRGVEGN